MLEFMGSDVIRSYKGELQEKSEVVKGNTTISSDGVRSDQKYSDASDAKKGLRILGPDGLRRDMSEVGIKRGI